MIVGLARLDKTGKRGPLVEALQQGRDRIEAQTRAAPIQPRKRIEPVRLYRLYNLWIKRPLLGGSAESTIAHMPTRAPRNLRDLGSVEPAQSTAVEFADSGEGNMVEIHVQPHADRVRGDEIIDLARLEHADLRVARAGA